MRSYTLIRKNSIINFNKWVDWKNSKLKNLYEEKLIPSLVNDNDNNQFNNLFELQGEDVAKVVLKSLEAKNPKLIYNVTIPTKFMGFMIRFLSKRWLHKLLLGYSKPN